MKKISVVTIMDVRNSKERDVFWEAYRGCAEENRVGPDRSPFYVNWAKDFANFLPEKPLEERSRKDIEAFLADLGKRHSIADWQVSSHTFHHSGVYPAKGGTTHLLEARYDIRTVQELLGHANVVTTMIYTHVLNRPGLSVKSPVVCQQDTILLIFLLDFILVIGYLSLTRSLIKYEFC